MSIKKVVVVLNGELKGNKEGYKKLIGGKDVFFIEPHKTPDSCLVM